MSQRMPLRVPVDIIIVPTGTEVTLPPGTIVIADVSVRSFTSYRRRIDNETGRQLQDGEYDADWHGETRCDIHTDWKEAEHGR